MTFSFEYHLKALIYLHLQEYESGRELLQVLEEDDFAKEYIAPPDGVGRSTFFEAMNTRALPQLIKMYELLQQQAKDILPVCSTELGNLILLPPLSVLHKGCGTILLVMLLTLCGWVPGVIAASVVCTKAVKYFHAQA